MPAYRAIDLNVAPFTHELKAGPYSQVPTLRESYERLGMWDRSYSPAQLVEEMDAAGVEKALVKSHASGTWEVPYEATHGITSQFPDRLYGLAAIDPRDIMRALERLEGAVRGLGFVGALSYPHWFGLSPADRVYYPVYAKCVELDIPIQIQVGMAYQRGLRNVGHPAAIDAVAADFPELAIVGTHTGYPWEREMVSVAWKHENVYVGADSRHPRDWGPELVEFVKGGGREKVMFGTNYPFVEFGDALAGVDALGLDAGAKEHLLYKNIARAYRLS